VLIILYGHTDLRDTPGFWLCQGLLGVYACLIMYAQAQWSDEYNIWISDVYRNEVGGGNNKHYSIVLNTLVIPIYQPMSHRKKSSTYIILFWKPIAVYLIKHKLGLMIKKKMSTYLLQRCVCKYIRYYHIWLVYLPESAGWPLVGSLFGFDWLSEKPESCLLFRAVDLSALGNGPFSIISKSPYIRFMSALFSSINLSIRSLEKK